MYPIHFILSINILSFFSLWSIEFWLADENIWLTLQKLWTNKLLLLKPIMEIKRQEEQSVV